MVKDTENLQKGIQRLQDRSAGISTSKVPSSSVTAATHKTESRSAGNKVPSVADERATGDTVEYDDTSFDKLTATNPEKLDAKTAKNSEDHIVRVDVDSSTATSTTEQPAARSTSNEPGHEKGTTSPQATVASVPPSQQDQHFAEKSDPLAELYENWTHERQPNDDDIAEYLNSRHSPDHYSDLEQHSPQLSVKQLSSNSRSASRAATPETSLFKQHSLHSSPQQSSPEQSHTEVDQASLNELYANWEHNRQPNEDDISQYLRSKHNPNNVNQETNSRSSSPEVALPMESPSKKRGRSYDSDDGMPAAKQTRLDERSRSRSMDRG